MSRASRLIHHLTFTSAQRRILSVLLGLGIAAGAARYLYQHTIVDQPQPESGVRSQELADRIDPNQADWTTLAILPGVGEKRARDIIAKRRELLSRKPGQPAFNRAEDLYLIDGIGPATVERLRPYLYFGPDRPAADEQP